MFLKRFTYADSFKEPIILFSLNKLLVHCTSTSIQKVSDIW